MPSVRRITKWALATSGLDRLLLRLQAADPIILMYHGVSGGHTQGGLQNGNGKHVLRTLFEEQMRLLRRYRQVVSVEQLVQSLSEGKDTDRLAAVTFDDGYEN